MFRFIKTIILCWLSWGIQAQNQLDLKSFNDTSVVLFQNIEEVKILALGEASHGQGSFFEAKVKVFQNLVKNNNYRMFGLEAGVAEARRINDYIWGDSIKSKDALFYLGYGVWENKSFLNLIEWMRAYNDTVQINENKLYFVGVDCQKTHGAVKTLIKLCSKYALNFDKELKTDLLYLDNRIDKKVVQKNKSKLFELVETVKQQMDHDISINEEEKKWLTLELNTLKQKFQMDGSIRSNYFRALFMAENAVHIQEILNKPMVLSAHNGHISKSQMLNEMGRQVTKLIGRQYFALGFEFKKGSVNGFTYKNGYYFPRKLFIENTEKEDFSNLFDYQPEYILNFRALDVMNFQVFNRKYKMHDVMGCYGVKGCNRLYKKMNPVKHYDGILYIRETKAAEVLFDKRPVTGWTYEM